MPDFVPIKRALLSVSDKTDLIPLAKALVGLGVELVSTGGTARAISEAGIAVTPVESLTGFPEMMDGRVKTLHPKVHGGLLALRDDHAHTEALARHGIEPIDLVVINLYPFERTVSDPGSSEAEIIEQIDIGGPAMIRSAAKNFAWVAVVTAPGQYDRLIMQMKANDGATKARLRADLAAAAFARTSEYDSAIASYLGRRDDAAFGPTLRLRYTLSEELRYGENPHQAAALYRDPASTGPTVVNATQLHGKRLSYNNINDASAALETVKGLRKLEPDRAAACVVKHANPCGAAVAERTGEALAAAMAGDPFAAFGGILAVSKQLDEPDVEPLLERDVFLEVIVAASFTDNALRVLRERWANVRLLAVGDKTGSRLRKLEYRSVPGGMLVQDRDTRAADTAAWEHRAGPAPEPATLAAAARLEMIVRALSSNAVAIGSDADGVTALHGAGAGMVDRVAACTQAVLKAGVRVRGSIAASDAFFPFPDGPKVLIDAGVRTIVHPGGSKRDDETFELCDAHGVTCLTTGVRRFRH